MFPALLAIIVVAYAFLALKDFKAAVTVLLALLPTYLIRFEIGPVPTTLLEVCIFITLLVWFVKEKGARMDFLQTFGAYRIPTLLLIAAACFSVATAPDTFSALGAWKSFFIEPILLFFVFRSTFPERADYLRALGVLGGTVIAIALFALFQRITSLGIPEPWDIELRATSLFDFPNAVGLFVAPIVSAFVILSARKALGVWRQVSIALIITFGLLAAYLSQTEAVFVAIPAAVLLALLISEVPKRVKFAVGIFAVTVGLLALGLSDTIREKVLLQDLSGQVRISQWRETAAMLQEHPLAGAGLQGYPTVFAKYHDGTLYEIFQYPHMILFNFWVELGLLGILALIAYLVLGAKLAYIKRRDILALSAFAALFTMVIHGLVDVPFFKNDLAILTAFFLAMTLVRTEEKVEKPSE